MNQTFQLALSGDKERIYEETLKQLDSLLAEDDNLISSLANTSALLKFSFNSFSWVGFYLESQGELVVGPFQGKPACVRIGWGKGVCGAAAQNGKTIVVPDVSKFPGHIACDPMSKSEIVVPIEVKGRIVGVLDVEPLPEVGVHLGVTRGPTDPTGVRRHGRIGSGAPGHPDQASPNGPQRPARRRCGRRT